MLIYVVTGHYNYEPTTTLGVFASEEKAKEKANEHAVTYDQVKIGKWLTTTGKLIEYINF